MKGIVLDDNDDLAIQFRLDSKGKIVQGIVLNETTMQNTYIVLRINQGEIKQDPVLGTNLINFIRSKENKVAIEKQIKIHLTRAGIDYERVKDEILTLPNLKS